MSFKTTKMNVERLEPKTEFEALYFRIFDGLVSRGVEPLHAMDGANDAVELFLKHLKRNEEVGKLLESPE